ncbi:MAG: zinc ribbon domain-containing protein [Promethearchaeota archaeon]
MTSKKRNCPSCSMELPDGIYYCIYCGNKLDSPNEGFDPATTPVATEKTSQTSRCPSCNKELPDKIQYCVHCGTQLIITEEDLSTKQINSISEGEVLHSLEGTSTEKSGESVAPPSQEICPNCLAKTSSSLRFCTQCGVDLKRDSPSEKRKGSLCQLCGEIHAENECSVSKVLVQSWIEETKKRLTTHEKDFQGFAVPATSFLKGYPLISHPRQPSASISPASSRFSVKYDSPLSSLLPSLSILRFRKNARYALVSFFLVFFVLSLTYLRSAEYSVSDIANSPSIFSYVPIFTFITTLIIITPNYVSSILLYRRSLIETEVSVAESAVIFSLFLSFFAPIILFPGKVTIHNQVTKKELGKSYAVGTLISFSLTSLLGIIILVVQTEFLRLSKATYLPLLISFFLASWICVFLTFPIGNTIGPLIREWSITLYIYLFFLVILFIVLSINLSGEILPQ